METLKEFVLGEQGGRILQLVISILVILVVVKVTHRTTSRYIKNNTTRYQARKMVTFFGYIVLVISAMLIYNYKFSNLTLALGVAGAGIAFALQEVIVSIAGFLAILFGNFYKVGDRVKLGGIKGDVVDIGVLRTTLMEIGDWVNGDLYNGKMVRVANSFIFKEPVFNYSGDFPFLWDEIRIPIKHSSDYQATMKGIESITTEVTKDFVVNSKQKWDKLTKELYVENARIEPIITMAFDENWITITARYVVDFKMRRGTKNQLFQRIFEMISENDKIEVASAAYEVTNLTD